ncbi:hypothetical protein ACI3QN_13240, partial [Propionibacterium freudenreichii]|uniref:hypothetical protein n=1 Tax=Propionibacterium freudenreichii TaxID=1744 RepID=UPI003851BA12
AAAAALAGRGVTANASVTADINACICIALVVVQTRRLCGGVAVAHRRRPPAALATTAGRTLLADFVEHLAALGGVGQGEALP